jgi:Holliday junction resolvase-like predicted endonuclease
MDSKNKKGAVGEIMVAAELMKMGYDVFQNICMSGIADLVVLNTSNMVSMCIDVKSEYARYVRKDGTLGTNLSTRVKFENNVWYIGYIHQTHEILYPEGFFESLNKESDT